MPEKNLSFHSGSILELEEGPELKNFRAASNVVAGRPSLAPFQFAVPFLVASRLLSRASPHN